MIKKMITLGLLGAVACFFMGSGTLKMDLPIVRQLPSYQRGCEVASLAMVLYHAGVNVPLEELVQNLKYNPQKYQEKNGKIYFGNPHNGFVGNIYTFDEPGLGVYHQPIFELMRYYINNQQGKVALNMTGQPFANVEGHLAKGYPIWVITNATYKKLQDKDFITWQTEDGEIKITKWMHAVVITGMDEKNVYFNDPLEKRSKAKREDFVAAWEQMGRQAVSYVRV